MVVVGVLRQVEALDRNSYWLASVFAFISLSLNPVIYASRYDVFKRTLKQMMARSSVAVSGVT